MLESTLPPKDLDQLVDELRAARLHISPSEIIDAVRLLRRLAALDVKLEERAALGPKLRPIFCKSPEQRGVYDEAFARWAQSSASASERRPASDVTSVHTAGSRRRWIRIALALIAGLFLIAGAIYAWHTLQPEQVQIAAPGVEPATFEPPRQTQPAPTSTAPQAPADLRVIPGYRHVEVLRPWVVSLLLMVPLLAFCVVLLVASERLGRFIQRINAPGQIFLSGWSYRCRTQRLVPTLAASLLGRLDRHARISAEEPALLNRRRPLHVPRTVAATLRNGGILVRRYRKQRTRPSYLILVDSPYADSLLMLWAARWQHQGLDVDIRRVHRDKNEVPIAWAVQHDGGREEFVPLDGLPLPGTAQRLVVLGDGADLLDANGEWQPWTLRVGLWRWPERALFTTVEVRDWGVREEALARSQQALDPGFFVLPLDDAALSSWSHWLARAQLPEIQLSAPQRYPRLLRDAGARRYNQSAYKLAQQGKPLSGEEVQQLVAQLQLYLGENGFYWLCCCAVPPKLDAVLTQLLGEEYFRRAGIDKEERLQHHLSRTYPRLARLQWIVRNHLPDWLRIALLARLPKGIQAEVRAVVEGLLSRSQPAQRGSLPVALDATSLATASSSQDALYVGFMHGHSASELMLSVPGEWNRWLDKLAPPQPRWQRIWSWLASAVARGVFRNGIARSGLGRAAAWVIGTISAAAIVLLFGAGMISQRMPNIVRGLLFEELTSRTVLQHEQDVSSMAISPEGTRIATGSEDGIVRLWDAQSSRLQAQLRGHERRVRVMAFSSDGTRVVSGSDDGTLRQWNASTGRSIGSPLRGHTRAVVAAVFSADGTLIASGSEDRALRLWDAGSGRPLGEPMLGHESSVTSIAFDPRGTQVVSGSDDNILRVWDVRSGRPAGEPMFTDQHEGRLSYSADATRILRMGAAALEVWDAESRQLVREFSCGDGCLAFSSDGTLALRKVSSAVQLLDVSSGRALGNSLEVDLRQAVFDRTGTRLVSQESNRTLSVWHVAANANTVPEAPALESAYNLETAEEVAELQVARGALTVLAVLVAVMLIRSIGKVISTRNRLLRIANRVAAS